MPASLLDTDYEKVVAGPGEWARQQARREHLEVVRRSKWPMLAVVAGAAAVGVVLLSLFDTRAVAVGVGALWASAFWVLLSLVIQAAGTASRLMGANAEVWTSQELRRLGDQWRVLHNVPLQYGDADHVLVGPAGCFVVETKWSATKKVELLAPAAARQARQNADAVKHRVRAYFRRVQPVPVVVLWGPNVAEERAEADGVTVLHGSMLTRWLTEQQPDRMTGEEVEGCAAGLRQYIEVRESDPSLTPPSRYVEVGLSGVIGDVAAGGTAGVTALLLGAYAWRYLPPLAALAVNLALVALGLLARPRRRMTSIGTGAAAGAAGVLALAAAGYLYGWVVP